jgi:hypothetical protein
METATIARAPGASVHRVVFDEIDRLDFTLIKRKLRDPEEGEGWSAEACEAVEADYRRFLALKRAYPDRDLVPTRAIDAFWHRHILDTAQYAADCERVFGWFLHHYPYFGTRGDADRAALIAAFADTTVLWERHFGMPYGGEGGPCMSPTQCEAPTQCR